MFILFILKISIYFDRISQSLTTENTSKPFEELVDEKCRKINKNGTSHDSAMHLAQWMKGQFDESVIEIHCRMVVLQM